MNDCLEQNNPSVIIIMSIQRAPIYKLPSSNLEYILVLYFIKFT